MLRAFSEATTIFTCALVLIFAQQALAARDLRMDSSSDDSYWQGVRGEGAPPVVRRHYIQAEEVEWNYAPSGKNLITGEAFTEDENVFVENGSDRIGSVYLKCVYRGYTDDTFKERVPLAHEYLDFAGPVIHVEVGDTVEVTYKNTCSFPNSVHVHGLFYAKSAEGAPYDDNTRPAASHDDAVQPGETHLFRWHALVQSGPGPSDGSSVAWLYHSHTDEISDVYAGLVGSVVVTRRGYARPDGSPKDIDQEVFLLWSVMNENASPYIEDNIKRFTQHAASADLLEDDDFIESNLMHTVNGYVYGNQPVITMACGTRVRWYLQALGTEVDLHTPHWHANTVLVHGQRTDVVSLLPASMLVADMIPFNAGTWLMHCHVADHIAAGMQAIYKVTPCATA